MPKLLISVIVPTCHRNDLLGRCLECLAPGTQALQGSFYEVVVTDDGSRETAERMIFERFPWVRWVEGPRRGPACNRNNGARHASGEWLCFTDDDCLPAPGWLAAYEAAIRNDGGGADVLEGRTLAGRPLAYDEHAPINERGGVFWSCNLAVSRTFFQKVGGFDANFPFAHQEDVDFARRLNAHGAVAVFVPEATVVHPPRKGRGLLASIRQEESSVYLAAKHRLPVWRVINPKATIVMMLHAVWSTPGIFQRVRVACLWLLYILGVLVCSPFWAVRSRARLRNTNA